MTEQVGPRNDRSLGGQRGRLVVSLDFELAWGFRDRLALARAAPHVLGARRAVPRILDAFSGAGVRATWATVGLLFARNKRELLDVLPATQPTYLNERLSPYLGMLSEIGEDEHTDPLHYAPSLLDRIAATPGQEIGTHTFSHFYCLEPGQTEDQFDADLAAAREIGRRYGDVMRSLVFPRNQYNKAYSAALRRNGVRVIRVVPPFSPYAAASGRDRLPKRLLRLLDAYLPVVGDRTYPHHIEEQGLSVLPASAFLRPFPSAGSWAEPLRVKRILDEMTIAAHASRVFHLWWHPHNFATNLAANLAVLNAILRHYQTLRDTLGMESMSMGDFAPKSAQAAV